MNPEVDFSQYLRKSDQNEIPSHLKKIPESSEQETDFSQYMRKPERSKLQKAGRLAAQTGLGLLEATPLGTMYDIGVVSSPEVVSRENLLQQINDLSEEKSIKQGYGIFGQGKQEWTDEEENKLEELRKQFLNPEYKNPLLEKQGDQDYTLQGLAEKATGMDLHPESGLEMGARWLSWVRNPKNAANFVKQGLTPKNIIKTITPSGSEFLRAAGAGTAYEIAKDGGFGPMGTLASMVVGDAMGGGAGGIARGGKELLLRPKETLAKAAAKFTPKEKTNLLKETIKDFRDSGIQADLGSITDSDLIRWTQSRIAQSGLTGKALEDFKVQLSNQIREEYGTLARSLGEAKFASEHEAGEILKSTVKEIRDTDLAKSREFYKNAEKALKDNAVILPKRLASVLENIEKKLKPGSIKSAEQQSVLSSIDKLKNDIYSAPGQLKAAKVKDLINNKIALQDIINYEVQGGSKQFLKEVVAELDRAIISHGKENPSFAKNYVEANKNFSQHAKTFRNKDIDQLLRAQDPSKLMNRMESVQGIRNLDNVLGKNGIGSEVLSRLKRQKLDQMIGQTLGDNVSQQAKLGTFSNILKHGKNKEVAREILGPLNFKKLEKLQKNAGKLAASNEKFFNASKSGAVAVDAAILYQFGKDIVSLLTGNPWGFMKTGAGIIGARKMGQLLADPEFLKLVEEIILNYEKGSTKDLINSYQMLRPYTRIMTNPESINQER